MRVLLTGGGTGGHIYPALALAEALKARRPEVQVVYVGTREGLEARIVPGAGIPFETISVRGLIRKSPLEVVRGMAALAGGLIRAGLLLRRLRPGVVVGTGGYVAGPVGLMAALMGIPLVLHEQNAQPSVTNRLLSSWARVVAVPFAEVREAFPRARRVSVTGNPVRPEILTADRMAARREMALESYRKVVVVTSGSRGAATINMAVLDLAPDLPEGTAVLLATGERYYDDILSEARRRGLPPDGPLRILPYIERMDLALAAADLVVSRAGAVSLAEITARGLPAVVVPSPNVTHDHQSRNAAVLERAGAALVIEDARCNGTVLGAALHRLLADGDQRREMARRSRALGTADAAERLVDLVLEAMHRKR